LPHPHSSLLFQTRSFTSRAEGTAIFSPI
jgi:hypothetical protein